MIFVRSTFPAWVLPAYLICPCHSDSVTHCPFLMPQVSAAGLLSPDLPSLLLGLHFQSQGLGKGPDAPITALALPRIHFQYCGIAFSSKRFSQGVVNESLYLSGFLTYS